MQAHDTQNVWVTQHIEKVTVRRICQNWYCCIATYITKSLQTFEENNTPVYKLKIDKLQLVLINVLIRSIFEHISQGIGNTFKVRWDLQ